MLSSNDISQKHLFQYQRLCQTVWIQIRTVCPDLNPNSLQRIAANDKSHTGKERVKLDGNQLMPCMTNSGLVDRLSII